MFSIRSADPLRSAHASLSGFIGHFFSHLRPSGHPCVRLYWFWSAALSRQTLNDCLGDPYEIV
jgi:hypothetical protein